MSLDGDDLNETDQAIINLLQQGRVTPKYLASELDISRPYASERLKRLLEHDHIERLAPGLYELTDDPREADTT